MRVGADQADRAIGVNLADAADGGIGSHPAANDQVRVVRHGFLLWFLRVKVTRVASSSPPALRSTARRVNGAAPVHREAGAGDKVILHEKQYRRGDVFGLPLAPH